MSFLQKIFGKKKFNAAECRIDEMTYLIDYRKHFDARLSGGSSELNDRQIAEIYIFRAWTVHYGYELIAKEKSISNAITGEVINSSKYLGLGVFQTIHGFSIEEVLGDDFISIVDKRWPEYDYIAHTSKKQPPHDELISTLGLLRLNLEDPFITYPLTVDFLTQMNLIAETGKSLGITRPRA